jgi:aminopeptidase N
MAGNLTRDEAAQRSRLLTVHAYDVEIDLTTGPETFRSTTVARFGCSRPGAATFVEIAGATGLEAGLNGTALGPGAQGRIPLPGLAAENTLRVVADLAYSDTGQGLHRFTDPVDERVYLHSQFATADAQRLFACFDQPDLKARYTFTVTAPADWEVVSNTAPVAVEAAGTARRWRFPATELLSTYLTALVAGPYHVVAAEYRGDVDGTEVVIPLRALCRQSLAPHFDAEAILDVTRRGLDFFQTAFGMVYPFGKYDQVFVPEFNLGAMENPGCVTFTETYVFRSRVTDAEYERRASTILHEMSHMWFGDLVTMRWWDDLWLNESFATYAAGIAQVGATRWRDAWTTFADSAKARAYRQDQLPTTHPIAADIPDIRSMEVNFDAITYQKGASVLKQLVSTIGPDVFLAALRRYFARHAWGTATLADLLAALTEESGRDLSGWSAQWLQTAGPNTLRAEFTVDGSGAFSSFAVLQSAPPEHPTLRSHRIAIGLYEDGAGELVRRHRVELDVAGPRTEVAALIGQAAPKPGDLVLVNDDDLTYAKIRLDPQSLETVLTSIGRIGDPLAQAVCWTIAWDLVRDAELAPDRYVELVLSGIGTVSNASVRRTLLAQAVLAAKQYLPLGSPALARLAEGLLGQARAAGPGSPEQLAFLRAFITSAAAPEQLTLVEGLLDGTGPATASLPGAVIDTDLRWSLLFRLVLTGRAGPEQIAAELRRDPTDKGRSQAAACAAAVPTHESKAAAWQAVIAGEQPLGLLSSTLAGFHPAEHTELVEDWAPAYFDVLAEVADRWPSERTQTFAKEAFPRARSRADLPALTEHYLAEAQPPGWLRRLVLEGADEVARVRRILAG